MQTVNYFFLMQNSPKNINAPLRTRIKKPNSNANCVLQNTLIRYDNIGAIKATKGLLLSRILYLVNNPKL